MAARTPQRKARGDELDDDSVSTTSITDGDDDEEEDDDDGDDADDDDDDDEDEADDDGDEDDDDDDEADDDGDEEDDDGDDEDDDGDEEDDDDDGDDDIDPATLRDIGGDGRVPISRLNEVLETNRRLMAMLEGKGGGQQQPAQPEAPAFDLKAKIKERNAKLLEGDEDAASAIDLEIEEHRQMVADQRAAAAAAQTLQEQRVKDTIADLQRAYPQLDDSKKNKAFDPLALDKVLGLRDVYYRRGVPLDRALKQAAKDVLGKPSRGGREREVRGDRNERTLQQKREAIRRARAQPPRLSGIGSSGRSAKTAEELSEAQLRRMPESKFRALDARAKAEARGDFVKPRRPKRRGG